MNSLDEEPSAIQLKRKVRYDAMGRVRGRIETIERLSELLTRLLRMSSRLRHGAECVLRDQSYTGVECDCGSLQLLLDVEEELTGKET